MIATNIERRQIKSRRRDDVWPDGGAVVIAMGIAALCGFGFGFLFGWVVG